MKILRLCKDMSGETPSGESIKEFFQEMRIKHNKGEEEQLTDRGIFNWWSGYLGGRGYNKFLDYGLFALKLNAIYNKHSKPGQNNEWRRMEEAITNLLADDRHDMYQNVPYELDDVAKTLDTAAEFWTDVVDAMIDCINVEGTGDIAHTFRVEEV